MSEGGGDDAGNGEEYDSMTITTADIVRDIVAIDEEIQVMSDGAHWMGLVALIIGVRRVTNFQRIIRMV